MTIQRTCNTCGETKDLNKDNFYPSRYHEGFFNTQCRKCNVAQTLAQEKALRESNPGFDPNSKEEKKRKAEARQFYRKRAIDDLLKQGLHHCKKCGLNLPVGDFNAKQDSYSGLQPVCKQCKRSSKEDKAKE